MYVYMCMCMYACMCVYVYVCMYVYVYTCICVYIYKIATYINLFEFCDLIMLIEVNRRSLLSLSKDCSYLIQNSSTFCS